MPMITVNGADLYYEDSGQGSETIVFSHGLLFSTHQFDPQVVALKDRYRVIAYDHRGQGQSQVTESGYDMETLADDAAELIEALKIGPCHFAGLSMGGFMGMRLAARKPHLIKSLLLIETTADPEPESNRPKYRLLNFIAGLFGVTPVVGAVMKIMFSKSFLTDPAKQADRDLWRDRLASNKRTITRAVNGVISRKPIYDEIHKITCPTLVIVGEEDVATVPAKAERIAARIPRAKLVRIPKAGHSSSVEQPEAVNRAIVEFLESLPAN
jgi:3-oxoadipate enol-lactonase